MTYVHPNLSEHYGGAFELGDLPHRLHDAKDHIELAAAIYDATALPPIELRRVMRALARREGATGWEEAHELVVRRLRALLRLDIEDARVAARACSDAYIDLPSEWCERNQEIEFAAIKNALHVREFVALTDILPWLRDHEGAAWLLERLPEGDPAELLSEAGGIPTMASSA